MALAIKKKSYLKGQTVSHQRIQIAILGATSEIAKDLILSFSHTNEFDLTLFARRPEAVVGWLHAQGLDDRYAVNNFSTLNSNPPFDALINFVGAGNPATALEMGSSILDITHHYDTLALSYLQKNPGCRYIFLSSGAAYGSKFSTPANHDSHTSFRINNLNHKDWYGVSKFYAEARHRSLSLPIIDIRIFNYFSRNQNINSNFFISEIVNSIITKRTLFTSPENIVRDYIGSEDFFSLITKILQSPSENTAVDCYSKSPVDKKTLLATFKEIFNLQYEVASNAVEINGTGFKESYYSTNYAARKYGYAPKFSSLTLLVNEARQILVLK